MYFIIFSKEIEYGLNFARNRLGLLNNNKKDDFHFSNNFDEGYVDSLKELNPKAVIIFITKGINPGDPGVWDAHYIIDDKEDVKKWKSFYLDI